MRELIVVGYGNQGRAWAQNLRDSGWQVYIGGRPEKSGGQGIARARDDGFSTLQLAEIAEMSSPVAWLVPDEAIPKLHRELNEIRLVTEGNAPAPRSFIFAHGYAVVHGGIKFLPGDDAILVAPKGIGKKLRTLFAEGSGVLGVLGVEKNASGLAWPLARALGEGLGCARVGLVESSFAEETNADLLSEQAILCGALPRLIGRTADFLIRQGISPKVATYECLNEAKLILEMMLERGIVGMYENVSSTARIGGFRAADTVLPEANLEATLETLWGKIISGEFARELAEELRQGEPTSSRELNRFRLSQVDENR